VFTIKDEILVRYTLRVNPLVMKKIAYIADYHGRSKNKEIEQVLKGYISNFEKEHGEINAEN